MSERDELEDRLLDTMLGEVEGQVPDEDLVARTLARRDEPALPAVAAPAPSRWLLAAAVLAIGVVTALAVSTRGGAGGGESSSTAAEGLQDPDPRTPEQWIEALRDERQVRTAVRALVRSGKPAVPAMIAALADDKAPRAYVLEALNAMGPDAKEALPAVAGLVPDLPTTEELLGPVIRAVATLAPFGTEKQRNAARRAVLFKAFVDNGPAAGGAGARVALGPTYSTRDVGRMLHRLEVGLQASTEELIAFLADSSPYVRELAAQLLRDHDTKEVRIALRHALVDEHPTRIQVAWKLKEGFSGTFRFAEEYDGMIRLSAARSLARLAGGEAIAALAHVELLRVGSLETRRRAAGALARIEVAPRDREAVGEAVVAAMSDDDAHLLRELAVVAGRLPTLSSEARAALEALAQHGDRQVAACASAALRMHR